jgi:hypothetical protein
LRKQAPLSREQAFNIEQPTSKQLKTGFNAEGSMLVRGISLRLRPEIFAGCQFTGPAS